MGLSLSILKKMLEEEFPTGANVGRVFFLKNPATKLLIPLVTADINAATLTVNDKIPAPGANEPNRNFAVGTRFRFTAISGVVSIPQIALNRIYHVLDVTGDDLTIGEMPLDLPANGITFTANTGTATIEELFISESITTNVGANTLTELSELTSVADAARFEVFLGAAVDRPEWQPNAVILGRENVPTVNTLQAIMPRGNIGSLQAGIESTYDGLAYLIGGAAAFGDTTGSLAFVESKASAETLQASVTTTLLLETFLQPTN